YQMVGAAAMISLLACSRYAAPCARSTEARAFWISSSTCGSEKYDQLYGLPLYFEPYAHSMVKAGSGRVGPIWRFVMCGAVLWSLTCLNIVAHGAAVRVKVTPSCLSASCRMTADCCSSAEVVM